MPEPLIQATDCGLYCAAGGFYIDPWRAVPEAVVTHAHADHARPGSGRNTVAGAGEAVFRTRLGADAPLRTLAYGEPIEFDGVRVSLHPAGHILGSAQVRVESPSGEVWVVSGDYKSDSVGDGTCAPFELVPCDVFISESTFGLPVYRWPDADRELGKINDWWRSNASAGRASVLYAYSLGKAQRVLAGLDATIGSIIVHGAVAGLNEAYEASGVSLPAWHRVRDIDVKAARSSAFVIAPPSAGGTTWLRRFGAHSDAFASGWMAVRGTRRWRSVDRGFVISDHDDWAGLLRTIEGTGARRIGVTHGYTSVMVRWLREHGLDAWEIETRFTGDADGTADAPADDDAGAEH